MEKGGKEGGIRPRTTLRGILRQLGPARWFGSGAAGWVLAPALIVGAVGSLVALKGRESDTEFIYRQLHPVSVRAGDVEEAVRSAPEPLPGGNGNKGMRASCKARGRGQLRSPWACTVSYPSGKSRPYLVVVSPGGAFRGQTSAGLIRGCCVRNASR